MVEKIAAAVAVVLSIILGTWAKMTFVRRREIYRTDGKPIYQHADTCRQLQADCNKVVCKKIDEVKQAQIDGERKRDAARADNYEELRDIRGELKQIGKFIGNVEQYMKDHQ